MNKPIFCSQEHRIIITGYTDLLLQFTKDVASESRYNNYVEVFEMIVDYHNEYGEHTNANNFYDWLTILPINLSVMTNGFFAGLETKANAGKLRSYKALLDEMLNSVVHRLNDLKIEND